MLEIFRIFGKNLGKGPLCHVIPLGQRGALDRYPFAAKEHKMKLNHGYTTFSLSQFNSI